MLPGWIVLVASLGYLLALFAIAFYGDKRADQGRSLVANPYVYALSIAVYCTSWTFYGSVGRAAATGVGFLPIYLGPTLVFTLGFFVLHKILHICKTQRITSIADFIASRYGKSQIIAGLVTVIAVVGTIPYIALQLKAITTSFGVLLQGQDDAFTRTLGAGTDNTALIVTVVLATFAILFGTRHIDATEHHEGMVVAIAVESLVKLIAFVAVGMYVTFGLFDGFGDIFSKAAAKPELVKLMTMQEAGTNWGTLMILAMAAIICLPRQFQVTMVENNDEKHLKRALYLFPLYLLAINIFVLPIAFGGLMTFPNKEFTPDAFVLALPLAGNQPMLALLVFIGGLSAATAMVIVASVALSTMVCNDLVMPGILRYGERRISGLRDLTPLLLGIRRVAIVSILLFAYLYLSLVGNTYALVSIGLVSFCAAAQFAPVMLIGIYWKGGSQRGAMVGLALGFIVWAYTLLLPSFAQSDILPRSFIDSGPFGIDLLKPHALFGLTGLDTITHALFWSWLFNAGAFITLSLMGRPSRIEKIQATLFVEAFQQTQGVGFAATNWRGTARVSDLRELAERFVGKERSDRAFADYAVSRDIDLDALPHGDSSLIQLVERLIAGAIGAASARVTIASAVKGEQVSLDEIMEILDETTHVLEYSRQLEHKQKELEAATAELRAANERLTELDRLKDEFLSTVSHELRTPLTSIRSFSEILQDDTEMPVEQRGEFLGIIVSESERLTRLINDILDMAKIEAGRFQWNMSDVDLSDVVRSGAATLKSICDRDQVELVVDAPKNSPAIHGDKDRLTQVVINLMSNAAKFVPKPGGVVTVGVEQADDEIIVKVIDNGPGIPEEQREMIFDKFHQVSEGRVGNPLGTGLGLAISQRIVEHMGGRIWVHDSSGNGSEFRFTIPLKHEMAEVAE